MHLNPFLEPELSPFLTSSCSSSFSSFFSDLLDSLLPLQSLSVSLASLLRRIRLTFEQRLVYPAGPDTPRDDLPLVIALKGARCHPTLRLWASAAARIAQSDSISSPTLKSKSFVAPRNGFFTRAFNPSTTIINCVAGSGCLDCLMFQVGCTGRRL